MTKTMPLKEKYPLVSIFTQALSQFLETNDEVRATRRLLSQFMSFTGSHFGFIAAFERKNNKNEAEIFSIQHHESGIIDHDGPDVYHPNAIIINTDNTAISTILKSNRAILLDEPTKALDGTGLDISCQEFKNVVGIPIHHKNQCIGLFLLASRHCYDNDMLGSIRDMSLLAGNFMKSIMLRKEQRQTFDSLVQSEINARNILTSILDPVIIIDHKGMISYMNNSAEKSLKCSVNECVGKNFSGIFVEQNKHFFEELCSELFHRRLDPEQLYLNEYKGRKQNGDPFTFRLKMAEVRHSDTDTIDDVTFVCVLQEITDLKRAQLLMINQGQLDVLGQVSRGVSHDFNNILNLVRTNLELVEEEVEDDFILSRIAAAIKAVDRGTELTQKLVKYTANREKPTASFNLSQLIDEYQILLKGTMGSKFELDLQLDPKLPKCKVIAGDFFDAVINLCVNARDAMEEKESGSIVVKTETISLAKDKAELIESIPLGDYIQVSVIDEGTGISEDNMSKILRPFFTTKPKHKGTGLGLSQIQRFMQNCQGFFHIDTEEGKGTNVQLLFPISS